MKEIEEEVKGKLRGNVVSHLLQVFGFCKECKHNELPKQKQRQR
jgi:hypothetical protein